MTTRAAQFFCLLTFCLLALPAAAGRAADGSWSQIDPVVEATIAEGKVPGAVVLVGHRGRVVYRKAFGNRSLQPQRQPMTPDTLFDMASLTKVVATTSAVMTLVQEGKIRLNDPVTRYWPEWGQHGKERVTIRQLMTHSSGLQAWDNYLTKFADPNNHAPVQDQTPKVLEAIAALELRNPPDTRFVYSDLGFITLGEIVRRVSGEPLDRFVQRRVFQPLGMRDTTFNPGPALAARAAPTEQRNGAWLVGAVHDPNSAVMGGVAGHAGLFSTADDLARFAMMLLSSDNSAEGNRETRKRGNEGKGEKGGSDISPFPHFPISSFPLSPYTVRAMTTPQSAEGLPKRGLGWDIDSGYSGVRGNLLPIGSFGHTGFTGTYIWVDPYSETFIIGLSNRVHPNGQGNANEMWAKVANIVAGTVQPQALPPRAKVAPATAPVLTGIDVLQRDGFAALKGRKVGLITNPTGINRNRESTIDLIHKAPGVQLVALLAPEHGLRADVDAFVASSKDEKTGLPIHSLYSRGQYKPTPEMLQGLDTLVFDIQDVGVRYYTYITTLGLAMEAAKEKGLKFVVLDRPNPINGVTVDGPILDQPKRAFSAYYELPVRHGMTVGELAQLYNEAFGIGCDLTVVRMENWRRDMWFDQTGVPWVNPSPNIRNTEQAELYPGIGLFEAANVSVGRGTDTPFERFGAPWIDGNRLAAELNRRRIPGLAFVSIVFTPNTREFTNQRCGGVEVRLLDREAFDGTRTAIEILDALVRLFPDQAQIDRTAGMFGTERIPQAIKAHQPIPEIVASYQDDVRKFRQQRQKYLIYR